MADRFITPRWLYLANKLKLQKQRVPRLPKLPVDMLCCVLGFLKRDDLARFSSVSHNFHSVATLDHLWKALLIKHLAEMS
jgi:hypothetical protein